MVRLKYMGGAIAMAISPKRQNQVFKKFFNMLDEPDDAFEQWLREQPDANEISGWLARVMKNKPYPKYRVLADEPLVHGQQFSEERTER